MAAVMVTMLLLAAMPTSTAFAADTGYFSPSYARTTGKNGWINPTYSFASDNLYATTDSQRKQMRLESFGITPIQGNSTVKGIVVAVEGYTDGRQVKVEISGDAGATWTSPKQTALSGTEGIDYLGAANNLWGLSWTADNFTNSQFKMRITSNNGAGTLYIDQVQVKIYFQPPNTTLVVAPVSENYGIETTTFTATLTETTGGAPIEGRSVDFELNGVYAGSALTDSLGVASVSGVDISTLAAGTYGDAIKASFAGDGTPSGYQATYGLADLTIVGIPLTVTADPQTKWYGYDDPVLTYTYTGTLLAGDSFSGQLLRDAGGDLGAYYINQGTLTAGPGYTITYVGDFLTIEPAPLTVTAYDQTKLETDPAITDFTFSYDGFVLGQDASALTTAPTCQLDAAVDQSVPGTYTDAITCSGGAAINYTFTYVPGTLTVNAVDNVATDITLSNNSVEENHLAGATIGTLGNNDPDLDTFTYSLVESGIACPGTSYTADNSAFTIVDNVLKTAAVMNFETQSSYAICVQVDDGRGGLYQKELSVNVTDLPETFLSVATQDGWILESTETSGVGGTKNVRAGVVRLGDDAYNRQYRSILSFNTSALPAGATITKVTIRLTRQGIVGRNPFATHGNLIADMRLGSFRLAGLQLSDFRSPASLKAAALFNKTLLPGNLYEAVLSPTALTMLNGTSTHPLLQFRLRFQKDDNNDFGADYLKIYSGNALAGLQPQLVVEYTLP